MILSSDYFVTVHLKLGMACSGLALCITLPCHSLGGLSSHLALHCPGPREARINTTLPRLPLSGVIDQIHVKARRRWACYSVHP